MGRKRKDTKTKILELSAILFAEKGKNSVGIREIATKASVSLNTIMYHFTSKENLYLEAVKHILANGIGFDEIFSDYQESSAKNFREIMKSIFSEAVKPKHKTFINMLSKITFSRECSLNSLICTYMKETESYFTGFFDQAGLKTGKDEISFLLSVFWTQLLYHAGTGSISVLTCEGGNSHVYAADGVADIFISKLGLE